MPKPHQGLDEDWIKRRSWDLPTTLTGLQGVIGDRPSDMVTFLTDNVAAEAMPIDLLREVAMWLTWHDMESLIPTFVQARLRSAPPSTPSAGRSIAGRLRPRNTKYQT